MTTKLLSTSALAREMGMKSKDLFELLLERDYIGRENDNWVLTQKGMDAGGRPKLTHSMGSTLPGRMI